MGIYVINATKLIKNKDQIGITNQSTNNIANNIKMLLNKILIKH
jgi:hypothetical protein